MKLYLVRHAKADKRSRWQGPDALRQLSPAGQRQAEGLVPQLAEQRFDRILASPAYRCRDTLRPLAGSRGIPLELDCRLAENAHDEAVHNLVRALGHASAVVCSDRRVIARVLEELLGPSALDDPRIDKGGTWLVEGDPGGPLQASYFEPIETPIDDPGARAVGPERLSRVAVLDMGSTSFNLVVFEVTPEGALKRVTRERAMLRLGAELGADPRIPEPVCERSVDAARRLRRVAEEAKAERLIPVATAALREAQNGRALADRLGSALGVPVWILDGEQEARVIFAALRHRLELGAERTLGVDLGGGSLELAVGDGGDVFWETTLRLGVERLHGELVQRDPMKGRERRAVRDRVRELLAPHRDRVERLDAVRCVGVGGTVGALARLWAATGLAETGLGRGDRALSREDLEALTQTLVASTHAERLEMAGMDARRADLLPTGALILATLLDELGYDELGICDWGLREGVILLEALGR
jgi:phosphohistidine phosphatase SixA